jgi:hypothetical protein
MGHAKGKGQQRCESEFGVGSVSVKCCFRHFD